MLHTLDRVPKLVDPTVVSANTWYESSARVQPGLEALSISLFLLQRLDAVERAEGGQRDHRHGDASLDKHPEDVPLEVDRPAGVAVDGRANGAGQTNGEHADGEAEEGAEDDFLAEADVDFPEELDGDCYDCNGEERRLVAWSRERGEYFTNWKDRLPCLTRLQLER